MFDDKRPFLVVSIDGVINHSSTRDAIMAITAHQQDLLERLQTSYTNGLTTGDASRRREENDSSTGGLNSVRPPINCPKWVCCLL